MKVSVVVVVFTEYNLAIRCIQSVLPQLPKDSEIILVHNHSPLPGVKKILQRFPQVRYIRNADNIGFGQAVQKGVEVARSPYVLVLTPDTLLYPHTVPATLHYISRHPEVAYVGCRVYAEPNIFNCSAFYSYPNFWSHLLETNMVVYKLVHFFKPDFIPGLFPESSHKKILHPAHMVGAYMLLNKKAVLSVGGFDKRFFLYREETDLCKRLRAAGWRLAYLPLGGVKHSADGAVHESITQASAHYLRSTYLFFKKHYGFLYALLTWLVSIISCLISIPFLWLIGMFKKLIKKPSNALFLMQTWIKILKWHLSMGWRVLLFETSTPLPKYSE